METKILLAQRHEERASLLAQAVTLVENDPRIVAAWLFGSGHRGDADAFSDIDLWTVVDENHINEIVEGRHAYVQQMGQPLLTLDVGGNAPVGGGYLMVQYPGSVGPRQVDWYWQPQAQAVVPDDAKLLFDRVGLPRAEGAKSIDVCYLARGITPPTTAVAPTVAQQLQHELTFFWCMALIAAKYVARRDQETTGWMLLYAAQKLDQAVALVHAAPTAAYAAQVAEPATLPLAETMAILQQLHMVAVGLLPHLAAMGGVMPDDLDAAVQQFLDLADTTSQLAQVNEWVRRP